MSIAFPARILQVGHADPRVLRAAKVIQRGGWRVTSIFRPGSPNHSKGIALDIAPMVYVSGHFGLRTARLVLRFLNHHLPGETWLVVSELDHVHVQVHPHNAIGMNTPTGTYTERIQ